MANTPYNEQKKVEEKKFIEILGDTVSGNQLIISIILSVAASFLGYQFGQWVFPKFAEPQMINSYSLLTGITGILIVVAINTILFKPKRILVEDEASSHSLKEAFEDLQIDIDEEIRLIEEDPVTKKELEDFGILSSLQGLKGADKK